MTASDVQAGTWAPCGPPFSSYEASDGQPDGRARVRSVDRRLAGGRRCKGQEIAQFKPGKYWQVTIRDDSGRRRTIEVHALVVPAHEKKPCPPGMQVRHYDDDPDHNAWAPGGEANCGPGKPGNLIYGTPKQQWDDKLRNREPVTVREAAPERRRSRTVIRDAMSRIRRWFV